MDVIMGPLGTRSDGTIALRESASVLFPTVANDRLPEESMS